MSTPPPTYIPPLDFIVLAITCLFGPQRRAALLMQLDTCEVGAVDAALLRLQLADLARWCHDTHRLYVSPTGRQLFTHRRERLVIAPPEI